MKRKCCPVYPVLTIVLALGAAGCPEDEPDPEPPVPQVVESLPRTGDLPDRIEYSGRGVSLVHRARPSSKLTNELEGHARADIWADEFGVATVFLPTVGLPSALTLQITESTGSETALALIRVADDAVSNHIPNLRAGSVEPGVFPHGGGAASTQLFTGSREPTLGLVRLADRTVGLKLEPEGLGYATLGPPFLFVLHYQTRFSYEGPLGSDFNHSNNAFVVREDADTAYLVTPALRRVSLTRSGDDWLFQQDYPAQMRLNSIESRWELTMATGERFFFVDTELYGLPNWLVMAVDRYDHIGLIPLDYSGFQTGFRNEFGPDFSFVYENERLRWIRDDSGREWQLRYSGARLTGYDTPAIPWVDDSKIAEPLTETTLASSLRTAPLSTGFRYENPDCGHLSGVENPSGEVYLRFEYNTDCTVKAITDPDGRTDLSVVAGSGPAFLPTLDTGNQWVRETNEGGDVTDWEIHGAGGGPRGAGDYGLRRAIQWTQAGLGNTALRTGDPDYFEQRWLHDSDSLTAIAATDPYRSDDGPGFSIDTATGMPIEGGLRTFEYNDHRRQITRSTWTDGVDNWEERRTYKTFEEYSGVSTYEDGRTFDGNPINTGLDFTVTYEYNDSGDLTGVLQTATRGPGAPHESRWGWSYDDHGRVEEMDDPNGNITTYAYHSGANEGSWSASGEFAPCVSTISVGAAGSADPAVDLTHTYKANRQCEITSYTDPESNTHTTAMNALGRPTGYIAPSVTLRNGTTATYQSLMYYNGNSDLVLTRHPSVEHDGTTGAIIDAAVAVDQLGRMVATRTEVDDEDAHDLIRRQVYENGSLIVEMGLTGGRTFHTYDERGLRLRTFANVAAGSSPLVSYPGDRVTVDLGIEADPFLFQYDARRARVETLNPSNDSTYEDVDSQGRVRTRTERDGSSTYSYRDGVGNVLTRETYSTTGALHSARYLRYDELGRQYLAAIDADPSTSEEIAVDPTTTGCTATWTTYDPGSRVISVQDSETGTTSYQYDAANRVTQATHSSGATQSYAYDDNGLVTSTTFTDGSVTESVEYGRDELGRVTSFTQGTGSLPGVTWEYAYDSLNRVRLTVGPDGQAVFNTYDLASRRIASTRRTSETGAVQSLEGYSPDADGRLLAVELVPDVSSPEDPRIHRFVQDDSGRTVAVIAAGSDDYLDGSADGADGVFDRVEIEWEGNNVVVVRNQRRRSSAHTTRWTISKRRP